MTTTNSAERARAEELLVKIRARYASHTGLLLRKANLAKIAVPNSVAVSAMLAFAALTENRSEGLEREDAAILAMSNAERAIERPDLPPLTTLRMLRPEYLRLQAMYRALAPRPQTDEPASGEVDRPLLLAMARAWWAQKMPAAICNDVQIKGDGRVDVWWSDRVESGRYTLPVTFMAEIAALRPKPAEPVEVARDE